MGMIVVAVEGTGKLSAALPTDLTITIELTRPAASRAVGLKHPRFWLKGCLPLY